ncbi:MAG: hypothetical protein AAB134_02265 [Pseudomonadota bacterium]
MSASNNLREFFHEEVAAIRSSLDAHFTEADRALFLQVQVEFANTLAEYAAGDHSPAVESRMRILKSCFGDFSSAAGERLRAALVNRLAALAYRLIGAVNQFAA